MIKMATLPPLLASNPDVVALVEQINTSETGYNKLVEEIQKKCKHQNCKKEWSKPSSFDKGVLLSKECTDCGLIQQKPKDMSWQICDKCWAPMKNDGHGMVGEDRAHFYSCTQCSHITYQT